MRRVAVLSAVSPSVVVRALGLLAAVGQFPLAADSDPEGWKESPVIISFLGLVGRGLDSVGGTQLEVESASGSAGGCAV